MELFRIL